MSYDREDVADLSSENELQEYLKDQFERQGWDAIREMSPDNSNYRVDLLLIHPQFGKIGIETKYLAPGDGGLTIARAHEQITQQYWDRKFWGEKILLWAICPYWKREFLEETDNHSRMIASNRDQFTREFFCHYGIGHLGISNQYAVIDYGYSRPERKIPAFPIGSEIPHRHYENVNIQNIRDSVAGKRGWS